MSTPGRSEGECLSAPDAGPPVGAVLAGRLHLAPGRAEAVRCERPMVSAAMMRRLTEGRPAALLPGLLGSVFALGATAQAQTARRALRAASGLPETPAQQAQDAAALRRATLAEHLQRLALDIPGAGDPGWLRAASGPGVGDAGLRRLFGQTPSAWLQAWQGHGADALTAWAACHDHPLARAFAALRPRASRLAWPSRPLRVADAGPAGWQALAESLRRDPDFAEHPAWQGAPAETGAWTRHGPPAAAGPVSAWARLGARLAEVAALADGAVPAAGALALAPREGIAWCEMSRGLLVHWACVDRGADAADRARVEAYRVLAPTEWNFHPDGAFARWLRAAAPGADDARLAALALDPCVEVGVEVGAGVGADGRAGDLREAGRA